MDYGAVGDVKTDDSQVYLRVYEGMEAICQDKTGVPILNIPEGRTFLLKPATFRGPFRSPRLRLVAGVSVTVVYMSDPWVSHQLVNWLTFSSADGLIIMGRGQIDGQGSARWSQPCYQKPIPDVLTFDRCSGLRINGLTHINSPKSHIRLTNCNGVVISNLRTVAPQNSPNTDGIDFFTSINVRVRNSVIGTGDDCIAITAGSSNVNIPGISCGPGHGTSIEALGRGGYDTVEEVRARNCTFKGTVNGVRLKTCAGRNGYARKISFEGIMFKDVGNPITIDQFYCPSQDNCQNKGHANIKLSHISFNGILGTSTTDQVISLSCSQSVGWANIKL
ncbi:Polygalacturonase [Bertholletia excelsa]